MFDLGEFLHHLERVRDRTRRVASCIPSEQIEWTYKAGAFTLGDLVRHIAVTERFIWAETVHNGPTAYVSHGREIADGRDAVLALLDRLHEESVAQFRALTPAMLAEKCVTPAGTPLTTWKWLRMLPEHEIHHRGQIYTMLAMLNVPTPPLYGLTSSEVKDKAGTPSLPTVGHTLPSSAVRTES
jgi:uncharacterized damage-inducible protein DinB